MRPVALHGDGAPRDHHDVVLDRLRDYLDAPHPVGGEARDGGTEGADAAAAIAYTAGLLPRQGPIPEPKRDSKRGCAEGSREQGTTTPASSSSTSTSSSGDTTSG